MKLNRQQAVELNTALSQKGLKARHVSGVNYIKLINAKIALKNSLSVLSELENDVAEDFGASQQGAAFYLEDKEKIKEFTKNLREKQKAYLIELELNFIPENELKEFTKEQDTEIEAVLFEYLLIHKPT